MSYCQKVQCIRCGKEMEGEFYNSCPYCKAEGYNINYNTIFDLKNVKLPCKSNEDIGIYRYREFFAMNEAEPEVSMGEGNTPLYQLKQMGRKLGLSYLYMKDESKNPTLSHKDRMCSIIVSKALAQKAPGVAISSTGNQGASTAAYCAVAGLPCIVFTTPNVSNTMKVTMQMYGAFLIEVGTMQERNRLLERVVKEWGFVPASGLMSPPIGSSCFGIDGYKTIAFEIYEQMGGQVPDWLIVPISYGDTLYGIYKGMKELQEMGYIDKTPKMAAAEVFRAVETALEQNSEVPKEQPGKPSIQTSIATGCTTYQTVMAVRESKGTARSSHDEEALNMQLEFARTEGVFAETASVASLVVLEKLIKEGVIQPEEKVIVLITSTGIKDTETAALNLKSIPHIEATMENLEEALKNCYGFSCPKIQGGE